MTTEEKEELEKVKSELAELKAELSHDNETRQQLLTATERLLPALAHQQEQWERQHAAHLTALRTAPELERLREEGLLPKYAVIATRVHALEEQFDDLRTVSIESYSMLQEIFELLKRLAK